MTTVSTALLVAAKDRLDKANIKQTIAIYQKLSNLQMLVNASLMTLGHAQAEAKKI